MTETRSTDRKHNHYYRPCPYDSIDVYRIIEMFEITCPAAQHILKKVIATGKRGHKDLQRDWEDIIDSARRKLDMLKEDYQVTKLNGTGCEVGWTPAVEVTCPTGYIPR